MNNPSRVLATVAMLATASAMAHDPIFGLGPHVLFEDGVAVSLELDADKAGDEKVRSATLELTYGLTGNWSVGVDLPYVFNSVSGDGNNGNGDISLFTKYRFWRSDSLGVQQSASVALKVVTDTADGSGTPALGKDATDAILGLAYGYESRKWYRWAALRYRFNGKNGAGVDRGDKILFDLVGGWRPRLTGYREPDTVWMLELNGEHGMKARQGGVSLPNTGGTELFLSPGIFWTLRNFAIKAGVQLPIYSDLNGSQDASDYRLKMVFEWHY